MLADKEGRVRLGDFGVSTRAGALADNAVVGSPYWMAPEVVSQGVASQGGGAYASDIWSVGCLVVELLEGKPPYHFLDPMPALFRIVNDDCPPIPESASATARDFMLQCFQKDPYVLFLEFPVTLTNRPQQQSPHQCTQADQAPMDGRGEAENRRERARARQENAVWGVFAGPSASVGLRRDGEAGTGLEPSHRR